MLQFQDMLVLLFCQFRRGGWGGVDMSLFILPFFPQNIFDLSRHQNGYPLPGSSPPPAPPNSLSTPFHTPPRMSPLTQIIHRENKDAADVSNSWLEDLILECKQDEEVDAEVGNDLTDTQHTTYMHKYTHSHTHMHHTHTYTHQPPNPTPTPT